MINEQNHGLRQSLEEYDNVALNTFNMLHDRDTPQHPNSVDNSLYSHGPGEYDENAEVATLRAITSSDLIDFVTEGQVDLIAFAGSEPSQRIDDFLKNEEELQYEEQKHQPHQQQDSQQQQQQTHFPKLLFPGKRILIQNRDTFPNLNEYVDPDFGFELNLNPTKCGKNSWYYSQILQKVFIKLDKTFYIEAVYMSKYHFEKLFLRAMIVFIEDVSSPVLRCANHICSDSNRSLDQNVKDNILRSENPEAIYKGCRNGKNVSDRLSVVIPLSFSKPDDDDLIKHSIALKFVCQNSCIGRKQTAIIFTLETEQSDVLGKRIVNVKVCSCPKRDKEKDEEKQNELKRSGTPLDCVPGKRPMKFPKIKEEPDATSPKSPNSLDASHDLTEVSLNIKLPNISSARHVVRCAFDAVAGLITTDLNPAKYSPYLKNLKKLKDQLEGKD